MGGGTKDKNLSGCQYQNKTASDIEENDDSGMYQ